MQKTSTYYKIRDILDATFQRPGPLKEVADGIHGRYKSFVYSKKDKNGKVREHQCDPATIRRKIRFCIELGLIESEEDCSLTDAGRNARGKGRFDFQLQQAVISYLEQNGAPLAKIESAINALILPDASSVYQFLAPNLDAGNFRTCAYLLAVCGAAKHDNILKSFQNRLYLTDAKLKQAALALKEKKE